METFFQQNISQMINQLPLCTTQETVLWIFCYPTFCAVAIPIRRKLLQSSCQAILGTKFYLYRINMQENPRCNFCGKKDETIDRLYWECKYISDIILEACQAITTKQLCFIKGDFFVWKLNLLQAPTNFSFFMQSSLLLESFVCEQVVSQK